MATDNIASIQSGGIGEDAVIIDAITTQTNMPLWAPVVLGAADTTSELPKVDTTTNVADKLVYGVTVENAPSE